MDHRCYRLLLLGAAVRLYLSFTSLASLIGNRVEFATPLNSYKRMQEGVFLLKQGIDPYRGDLVHETPLLLKALSNILINYGEWLPLIYIILDIFTAALLYLTSKRFVEQKLEEQRIEQSSYANDTKELQYSNIDRGDISLMVLLAYLFNPLTVMSCIGLTSTVISNLFLAMFLYAMSRRQLLVCLLMLAFESVRSLYPIVLIAPLLLLFARRSISLGIIIFIIFALACMAVACANFFVMNSWNYLDGTLGFIFNFRDLQPNIGLFWYFFTEMFEHFRTMFLITFQLNATVLYLVPLSIKLRKEPVLLATVLIALMSVFRAYPSLGDVGFYLALLPLWRRCWKFMAHGFVVFTFFLITLSMMGALWHLWIYAGSANANFYFGATLGFCTGQIFLITDLLFAHVKREFCLHNGQKIIINGKEARILLE
ncbi:LOW QUALITY PROTEIN: phosphatidylinositol glycan anchor biosynthesis class U protein [Drosophila busckii]|uniref:LOW QUALITY PROTEIN: phosphatidylinositol glycan anchor biosynthesis class U protein n=1 Tax=Drosophila busckii TaxID=30019 RepID=UPI001432BEA3|nr:LOW QUALITY PROTEIN: phosphatidylinositol glycan anchor biosynthesis class U protein [Drosophila busckii]